MSKEFLARTMVPNSGTKVDTGVSSKPVNKETGSCFQSTTVIGPTRVGQHPDNKAEANPDAFSGHHTTMRLSPRAYMKKGEGMGGTSNHTAAVEAAVAIAKRGAVAAPPKANATLKRPNPPNSALRMHYERGDLPLALTQGHKSHIRWAVDVSKLDYHHYLPIFASGLREVEEPFRTIAEDGFSDMVTAPGAAEKVFPVVSQLIIPLKEALSTRDERILVRVCRALGKLAVLGGGVAPALVPYFRQLLPVLNIYVGRAVNIGDAMDFAQRKGNIGELIQDTLQKLEIHGGPDAYINIKYMVPMYESAVLV